MRITKHCWCTVISRRSLRHGLGTHAQAATSSDSALLTKSMKFSHRYFTPFGTRLSRTGRSREIQDSRYQAQSHSCQSMIGEQLPHAACAADLLPTAPQLPLLYIRLGLLQACSCTGRLAAAAMLVVDCSMCCSVPALHQAHFAFSFSSAAASAALLARTPTYLAFVLSRRRL